VGCQTWMEKSSAQGNVDATFELGVLLEKLDAERAVTLFSIAVANGHSLAQRHLGLCFADGRGIHVDMQRAEALLTSAAEAGCPPTGLNSSWVRGDRLRSDHI
jgi:uncharacterized protein